MVIDQVIVLNSIDFALWASLLYGTIDFPIDSPFNGTVNRKEAFANLVQVMKSLT